MGLCSDLVKTPQIGLAVTLTKKRPPRLIQSSLSQSVKAAQITKAVIQLKLSRWKSHQLVCYSHLMSFWCCWYERSLIWWKGNNPDWTPHLAFHFPQSFPDVIVPFRWTRAGSFPKQSRWSPSQLNRLLVTKEGKPEHWGGGCEDRRPCVCDHRGLNEKRGCFCFPVS